MTTMGMEPMGGPGGIVEVDETFIGRKEGVEKARGRGHKNAVMPLIERRPAGVVVRSFHVWTGPAPPICSPF
jgi:hypothetical protein